MKYYLNLDKNNYLLSISTVGGGIETELDLAEYDFSGNRMRAYKWKSNKLVFDKRRFAEIEAENEAQQETETTPMEETTVYDELAAAYMKGVQEA